MDLTLPTDSAERKGYPMFSGLLKYFPAALAAVAKHSFLGNEKHNPGEPMHHARGKSSDHADCIIRHLTDIADLEADIMRNWEQYDDAALPADANVQALMTEANALAWRALALSQELHERFGLAPLAPGARLPDPTRALVTPAEDLTKFNGLRPGDIFLWDVDQTRHVSGDGTVTDAKGDWKGGADSPVYPRYFVRYLKKVPR